MQKYLFVSLCVLATFVSIHAKPWYNYDNCEEEYGGHEFHHNDGYHSNKGYRNYVAYGDRFRYHSQSGFKSSGGDVYNSGGHGGGIQYRRRPNYNYVPQHCPNCDIKSFGVGVGQTNTFNLAESRR